MAHPLRLVSSSSRTLPERIADHFVAAIFTGQLAPGERLPPDRELSEQLGVDRTSLRMAMQRLSHLGLVKATRGAGVRVLDYRQHAGIDLLSVVLELPDLAIGGTFMLELLDEWLDAIPGTFRRANARLTLEAARQHDASLAKQLAEHDAGASIARLAELEVALQDDMTRMVGSTTAMLFNNSMRSARLRLAALILQSVDVREHVTLQRKLVQQSIALVGAPDRDVRIGAMAAEFFEYMRERTKPVRKQLQALPVNPQLTPEAHRIAASRP